MCFSATADLVMGAGVIAVGVDAMRHVRVPQHRWVAALPLVLGTHQLIEALVWRGLSGDVRESVWRAAMWVYLTMAFGLVPILVPAAVGALEPVVHRRRMLFFTLLGTVVAVLLMSAVVRGPIEAAIEVRHPFCFL